MWVSFFVKQGTIYTHTGNRLCKSVIFMWYYGDPLGYSCKIWSCQYFDNPTHQCVAWYRQGLTADNQPKTLFMTFEVVISHEQKKTKRNLTSHSWNCDDAKGRIQNEWYIGSAIAPTWNYSLSKRQPVLSTTEQNFHLKMSDFVSFIFLDSKHPDIDVTMKPETPMTRVPLLKTKTEALPQRASNGK